MRGPLLAPDLELLLRRTNPWLWEPASWGTHWANRLPEPFLARHPVGTVDAFPSDKVTLVIGPRRAGKTTFLWSRCEELGPELVLVNCEEPLFRTWCTSPALFLSDLESLVPVPGGLMFDEVQHLPEAGLFLKGLADLSPGCPILATGSSSFHLMARTRESLAGRAVRIRLLPFSLREVGGDLARLPPAIAASRLEQRYARMLVIGSYPEAWLAVEPETVLSELVEGVVVRDASDLFRIDHPEAFRKLLRLMASQVGSLVNLAEWASVCGVSTKTVSRYVGILEEAHVVYLARPWLSGRRAELTRNPKVFFVDNGVRNAVLARLQPLERRDDVGALAENWVFGEVAKASHPLLDTVGFWRTRSGAEVDLIVETAGRRIAVEVKSGPRTGLSRSARSFIDAARPDLFVTVRPGGRAESELHGCRVLWTGPAGLSEVLAAGRQPPD